MEKRKVSYMILSILGLMMVPVALCLEFQAVVLPVLTGAGFHFSTLIQQMIFFSPLLLLLFSMVALVKRNSPTAVFLCSLLFLKDLTGILVQLFFHYHVGVIGTVWWSYLAHWSMGVFAFGFAWIVLLLFLIFRKSIRNTKILYLIFGLLLSVLVTLSFMKFFVWAGGLSYSAYATEYLSAYWTLMVFELLLCFNIVLARLVVQKFPLLYLLSLAFLFAGTAALYFLFDITIGQTSYQSSYGIVYSILAPTIAQFLWGIALFLMAVLKARDERLEKKKKGAEATEENAKEESFAEEERAETVAEETAKEVIATETVAEETAKEVVVAETVAEEEKAEASKEMIVAEEFSVDEIKNEESEQLTSPESDEEPKQEICPDCGTPFDEDALFCVHCGARRIF